MGEAIFKAVITAAFIVGLNELAKRSNYLAALLIALPLATAMTAAWLYFDTRDAARATHYVWTVLLLVPPGCLFLAMLPLGVRYGFPFWETFAVATVTTGLAYYGYTMLLQKVFGITL